MNRTSRKKEFGGVLIELSFALPAMLFLIFGVIELSRIISTQEDIQFISRVVATKVFRECTTDDVLVTPPAGQTVPEAVDRCLKTQVSNVLRTSVDFTVPQSQIVMSVYTYTPGPNPFVLQGRRLLRTAGDFGSTQCSNGLDDDGDGIVDMNDSGCSSPGDDLEGSSSELSRFSEARVADPNDSLRRAIMQNGNLVLVEVFQPFDSTMASFIPFDLLDSSTLLGSTIY